jgi:hypothetical protein
MDQNSYDFILQQSAKQKKPLGGGNSKQRIIIAVAGAAVLLILGFVFFSLVVGGGKNTTELLAPVSAAQSDIIEITEIGAKEARDTALINQTASTNLVIVTQNSATNSKIGEGAKKIIAPYQNTEYKKDLEDAKNSGSFDATYQAILRNRLDLYRQELVTAYNQAPTTKLKKELEAYYSQVGVLIGEQTTPQ